MSIVDSIIEWAEQDLPYWQNDAVRRLLTQSTLTESDDSELLSMIKNLHGLEDYEKTTSPILLRSSNLPINKQAPEKLTLKSINNLQNVNAIENGSNLLFGHKDHKGISVVFGENGTGKSGYARILKRACNARDSNEKVLPNVFEKTYSNTVQASFKIATENSQDMEINWNSTNDKETDLSYINLFDTKSANIIVDEANEVTYLPYGAHVFENLASLNQRLRNLLENEKPTIGEFDFKEIIDGTEAKNFLSQITHKTTEEEITEFAKWSEDNEKRFHKLNQELKIAEVNNPIEQAKQLRRLKDKINKKLVTINKAAESFSDKSIQRLNEAVNNYIEAKKAVATASKEKEFDDPFSGVGESSWQKLYNAAKDYSFQWAYPEEEFPQTGEGKKCVLCMQPLSEEASNRMDRFYEFMENKLKKQEENAFSYITEIIENMKEIEIPDFNSIKDLFDDVQNIDKNILTKVEKFINSIHQRSKQMIENAQEVKLTKDLSPLESNPKEDIQQIINQLEQEANEKEKNADTDTIRNLKQEFKELKARKTFSEKKQDILNYLKQIKTINKYDTCISELDTTKITQKGKKIITESLTPGLIRALKTEVQELGASHLPLNLKSSGSGGETKHKIQLEERQSDNKAKLSEILSEGEQRIVSLAGFLAELELTENNYPIIFDDPVSSLDHRYRERIAERIVKESQNRQIIIFTHDISFLLALEAKSGEHRTYYHSQTLRRNDKTTGLTTDSEPWHAMSVKKRINFLKDSQQEFKKLYTSDIEEYNKQTAECYSLLRETWESFIELELLNETVYRHSHAVQTQRLDGVEVTTEDYRRINLGMTKCSKWMTGHDKTSPLDTNRPSPGELYDDILEVENFRKEIEKRRKNLKKERKKAIGPETPDVG